MGEPILQNVWIIWSPILHFNLKGCIDPNSFIHYISMYYARFRSTFLTVFKFLQTKNGRPNFWREPILPNVWIIWSAFLYFNLKSSRDLNSSSFIRFQSLFHESAVLFSESWNFYKLKRGAGGGPNFWEEPILQNIWIVWSPLRNFNLKSSMNQNSSSFITFQCILHNSGDLFSESWNFYKSKSANLICGEN